MASGTANSTDSHPSPAVESSRKNERYIQSQLKKTSAQVKLVDFLTILIQLSIGVLGFLLVVSVVDAWLFELGAISRLLVLVVLLGSMAWYFLVTMSPLFFRRINPVFAARTIEQGHPSLKNSVINFLLFRPYRSAVHKAVYQALEQKAASDLFNVSHDTHVDRSKLIRAGSVLAGLLVACALYIILSPKDPMQTLLRVVAPFAELSRPSRVQIDDVQPGSKQVFLGETIEITAVVQGLASQDLVELVYSTADDQTVDRRILMQNDGGLRHRCLLPASAEGVQQDLAYKVVAGDAKTENFHLHVVPLPTITIEQIEYDYPSYTELPNRMVQRQGDIQALEGTRVTVRARANQDIRTAYIEFDPPPKTGGTGSDFTGADIKGSRHGETLVMQHDQHQARCSFVLKLSEDRKTPQHATYRVRFINTDGVTNRQPILQRIEVIADLSPEVEILRPQDEFIEVPLNGRQAIEIRALDPDFSLTKISLKAISGQRTIVDQALLDEPKGQPGQIIVDYLLVPQMLGLNVGDKVTYWAEATDNRTAPGSGSAEPNSAQSRHYTITIVEPETSKLPRKKTPHSPKDSTSHSADKPPSEQQGEKSDEGRQGDKSDQDRQGDKSDQGNQSGSGQSGKAQAGENKSSESQSGQGGSAGESTNQGGQGENQQSAGEGGNSSSQNSGQGSQSSGQNSGQAGRSNQNGQPESKPSQDGRPGSKTDQGGPLQDGPLHDGEVIEQALEHRRQQQGKPAGSQQAAKGNSQDSQSNDGQRASQTDSSAGNPTGKKPQNDNNSSEGKSSQGDPMSSKPKDSQSGAKPKQGEQSKGQAQKGDPSQNSSKSDGQKTGQEQSADQKQSSGQKQGSGQEQKRKSGSGQQNNSGQAGSQEKTKGSQSSDKQASGQQKKNQGQSAEQGKQGNQQSDARGDKPDSRDGDKPGQESSPPPESGKSTDDSKDSLQQQDQADNSKTEGSKSAGKQPSGNQGDSSAGETDNGDSKQSRSDNNKQDNNSQSNSSDNQTGQTGSDKKNQRGSPTSRIGSRSNGSSAGFSSSSSGELNEAEVPPGDEADLDYAREVTDLALEHLRDQKDNSELLKRLKMSPEELARFLDRWDRMKQAARSKNVAAKRELDESLRNLGLQPSRDIRSRRKTVSDDFHNLRDDSSRSQPPPGYEDLFRAFKKSTVRQKRD